MPDEKFNKRLKELMSESGYQSYGKRDLPVREQVWPNVNNQTPPIEQQEIPNQDQVSAEMTPKATVTSGETTPIDQPRDDIAQQNGDVSEDQAEVLGEISSLLITIGFILQSNGVTEDKFDFDGTLDFLNQTFAGLNPQQNQEQPQGDDVEVQVMNAPTNDQGEMSGNATWQPDTQQMQESRKLLESRFKK
jgi:hypothetical protein